MNWRLTLVSMVVFPPVSWAIRHYAIGSGGNPRRSRSGKATCWLYAGGPRSIRMVQAFGRESFEVDQFVRHATRSLEANFRLNMISHAERSGGDHFDGAWHIGHVLERLASGARGNLSLGDLLFSWPISRRSISQSSNSPTPHGRWRELPPVRSAALKSSTARRRPSDAPGAVAISLAKGAISFAGSSFAYDGKAPVLSLVDLSIAPGETVAFVGGTGAGKSTLLESRAALL